MTPWSAEKMQDAGRRRRVDVLVHAENAHDGFPQKKTERGHLLNRLSCSSEDPIGQGTELN